MGNADCTAHLQHRRSPHRRTPGCRRRSMTAILLLVSSLEWNLESSIVNRAMASSAGPSSGLSDAQRVRIQSMREEAVQRRRAARAQLAAGSQLCDLRPHQSQQQPRPAAYRDVPMLPTNPAVARTHHLRLVRCLTSSLIVRRLRFRATGSRARRKR